MEGLAAFDLDLPSSLPILGFPLRTTLPERKSVAPPLFDLPALLSRALFSFAIEFEQQPGPSLAACANVLRFFGSEPIRPRDLPRLSGVSKEAIAVALRRLTEGGFITKRLVLTGKGETAKANYYSRTGHIETIWRSRYDDIRKPLEALPLELLLAGTEPYPENWRASLPSRTELPHYPMILHRGGFPDGS